MYKGFRGIYATDCSLCLAILAKKHEKVCRRLVQAELISKKTASVDQEIEIPMVLMKMDVKGGWNRFQKFI
jgi:hypothetical protein